MFELLVWAVMVLLTCCIVVTMLTAIRSTDDATKAVLGDLVFYLMIGIFVLFSMVKETSFTYEVALLTGLMGLITTIAMARILVKGRR